ncbi:hypothetical protein A4X06_0g9827 [Tilletia controversa]|uniref:Tc1-like transposase DDE domain-containing protein n=1 Tax=Tilletia controversa TaxID=13291 RepID=A0A8X7MI27_9BASI|nr:hypothetical protein A4X06_0g9827 [Tilletia controversa]
MPKRAISTEVISLALKLVADRVVTVKYLDRNKIVSRSSFFRHKADPRPRRNSPGRPRVLPTSISEFLRELVLRRPALYLDEIRDIIERVTGIHISICSTHRYLVRAGITLRRAHRIAAERSELKRAAYELRIGQYDPGQLVFADETSYDARDAVRIRVRGRRGQKARFRRPYTRGKRLSCIAGLSISGCFAPWAVRGSFTEDRFYSYLQHELLPRMSVFPAPRSVLVLDNASIHHSERIRELVEDEFGCKLEFLPPYSPDFNPIERAFAKIKAIFRRNNATIVDANNFFDAIRDIPAADCYSWMQLAGYI